MKIIGCSAKAKQIWEAIPKECWAVTVRSLVAQRALLQETIAAGTSSLQLRDHYVKRIQEIDELVHPVTEALAFRELPGATAPLRSWWGRVKGFWRRMLRR